MPQSSLWMPNFAPVKTTPTLAPQLLRTSNFAPQWPSDASLRTPNVAHAWTPNFDPAGMMPTVPPQCQPLLLIVEDAPDFLKKMLLNLKFAKKSI
jgi:hypothetical protein